MINKEANNCPYCGSTNISQRNKLANKIIAKGVAFAIKQLTGLRGSSKAAEDGMDKEYVCLNCHKEWVGDGHNLTGLPEDEFQFQKVVSEICKGVYPLSSNEDLMNFCWMIHRYRRGFTGEHSKGITDCSYDDEFDISKTIEVKFLFLINYAILYYVLNNYENILSSSDYLKKLDLFMACEAGLAGCDFVQQKSTIPDNILCHYILLYITNTLFYESTEEERMSILRECSITNNASSYIFSADYWQSVIEKIKTI